MSKRIAICLTSRGNYARAGSLLHSLHAREDVDLSIVVAGGSVTRKFGKLSTLLREDGLPIAKEIHNLLEGGTPVSASKTTGLSMIEFSSTLNELDPDAVITIADRYETMAVTLAASYQNIPVIHTQGGEITGSIDEKVRHATTKLADYHFVSTQQSREVVLKLGEESDRIHVTGCPSIDLAREIREERNDAYDPQGEYAGVGSRVDTSQEYLVVQYHPLPTDYQNECEKTWEVIDAIDSIGIQAFWFWPNMDAGTDKVSKAIREFRDQRNPDNIRFYINMHPKDYLTLVNNATCLVGNSSVGIRECSFLGQPSVNIGERQKHRERADNVIDVPCETDAIVEGIINQLSASYSGTDLYGDGYAGEQMAELIGAMNPTLKDSMDPDRLELDVRAVFRAEHE